MAVNTARLLPAWRSTPQGFKTCMAVNTAGSKFMYTGNRFFGIFFLFLLALARFLVFQSEWSLFLLLVALFLIFQR